MQSQIDTNKIVELYQSGLSTRDVSSIVACSPSQVKRVLKKLGVPVRTSKEGKNLKDGAKTKKNMSKYESITKEYLNMEYNIKKRTIKSIAQEHGLSKLSLGKRLKSLGIEKRKGTRLGYKGKLKRLLSINDVVNNIIIKEIIDTEKRIYKCLCFCGELFNKEHLELKRVKSCGCLKHKTGQAHYLWKGHTTVPITYINKLRTRSLEKDLEFDLDCKYCDDLLLNQNSKCAISGVPIEISKQVKTASIDRIDSSKGYIKGNVQWVHKVVNQMKWAMTTQQFVEWCKVIATNQFS